MRVRSSHTSIRSSLAGDNANFWLRVSMGRRAKELVLLSPEELGRGFGSVIGRCEPRRHAEYGGALSSRLAAYSVEGSDDSFERPPGGIRFDTADRRCQKWPQLCRGPLLCLRQVDKFDWRSLQAERPFFLHLPPSPCVFKMPRHRLRKNRRRRPGPSFL